MKIDAPRAWDSIENGKLLNLAGPEKGYRGYVPVRIVRESDWRKIMAVVMAVDEMCQADDYGLRPGFYNGNIINAFIVLRKHLEKRK